MLLSKQITIQNHFSSFLASEIISTQNTIVLKVVNKENEQRLSGKGIISLPPTNKLS